MAILEEGLLQRVAVLVAPEHLEALVYRDVEQVLQRAPYHPDGNLGFEVGIDQVPQALQVLWQRLILTVHETEQEELNRLMQTM